jgi:hypothetical protein
VIGESPVTGWRQIRRPTRLGDFTPVDIQSTNHRTGMPTMCIKYAMAKTASTIHNSRALLIRFEVPECYVMPVQPALT